MIGMPNIFKQVKVNKVINWDAVYQEMLPRVYNFFRYHVEDDALAEDLTSTTFERAWGARSSFRSELGTIPTWIFAIARNAKIDHFRKARPEIGSDALESVADVFSVEEHWQKRDESSALAALLDTLNPRDRELVALKYGADMTNREIAKITGLSESNVGTILNRTVGKLRISWEANHER
jgi:RNA polymerase sigma-70 factor (ECF subfamily)